jgi:hypothetical protein
MSGSSSAFDSAKTKLQQAELDLVDLPQADTSVLWEKIGSACGLTLKELTTLQNYVVQKRETNRGFAAGDDLLVQRWVDLTISFPYSDKPTDITITPSKSNFSKTDINELQASLDTLSKSNVQVVIGNRAYESSDTITSLFKDIPETICDTDITDLADASLVETSCKQLDLRHLLSQGTGKEALAQNAVSTEPNLKLLRAVDTSKSSHLTFSMPRKIGNENNIYPASAKIDLLSTDCPMAMEFKSTGTTAEDSMLNLDVAGITQGLERICVVRSTNAALSAFIVFVVSGRRAWKLSFHRDVQCFGSTNGQGFETVRIVRIAHEDVWRHWFGYVALTASRPSWYLTPDAYHLLSTLNSITSPNLCGSRLYQASGHRVYVVSLPQLIHYEDINGTKKSIIGVSMVNPNLCIKIIETHPEFHKESSIASAVCCTYNELNPGLKFHLLGIHEITNPADTVVEELNIEDLKLDVDNELPRDTGEEGGEEGADKDDTISFEPPPTEIALETNFDKELDLQPSVPEESARQCVILSLSFLESIGNSRKPIRVNRRSTRRNECSWRQLPPQQYEKEEH